MDIIPRDQLHQSLPRAADGESMCAHINRCWDWFAVALAADPALITLPTLVGQDRHRFMSALTAAGLNGFAQVEALAKHHGLSTAHLRKSAYIGDRVQANTDRIRIFYEHGFDEAQVSVLFGGKSPKYFSVAARRLGVDHDSWTAGTFGQAVPGFAFTDRCDHTLRRGHDIGEPIPAIGARLGCTSLDVHRRAAELNLGPWPVLSAQERQRRADVWDVDTRRTGSSRSENAGS